MTSMCMPSHWGGVKYDWHWLHREICQHIKGRQLFQAISIVDVYLFRFL